MTIVHNNVDKNRDPRISLDLKNLGQPFALATSNIPKQ
jgi:hypothetical protein